METKYQISAVVITKCIDTVISDYFYLEPDALTKIDENIFLS